MIISGTNKIKGILDLSGIGKQLKAGDQLPITDAEFHNHTVQIAIKMGLLSYKDGNFIDSHGTRHIKLRNVYERPIRINELDTDVRPQETFILTEDQVNKADIRGALAKGIIQIVSSTEKNDIKETKVEVGDLFDDIAIAPLPDLKDQEVLETNEEASPPKTVAETETLLSPELGDKVINDDKPLSVDKSVMPDSRKKSVIWNPNKEPIAHTRTSMKSVSASKTNNDINFVDKKIEEENIQKHPILKDKVKPDPSDEIDFL